MSSLLRPSLSFLNSSITVPLRANASFCFPLAALGFRTSQLSSGFVFVTCSVGSRIVICNFETNIGAGLLSKGKRSSGINKKSIIMMSATGSTMKTKTNPLLQDWSSQPYHMPPFHLIQPEQHYEHALQVAMEQHIEELKALAGSKEVPTFENVIVPYDRSGKLFKRVSAVYQNMCSSMNTPELQPIESKMAPILSKHKSVCYLYIEGLFDRIRAVYETRNKRGDLTAEQVRLIERIYMDFTRAGAALSPEKQRELTELNAKLASLTTQFQQNVMKDEELYELVLEEKDMSGCPQFLKEAARNVAQERNKDFFQFVITLRRSLVEPFLTFSARRDLRKEVFEAWVKRGETNLNERDNLSIAVQILQLRQRFAEIHGYPSFAHYQCADRMAETPEQVMELLESVWKRAKVVANREREDMEQFLAESGETLEGGIQPYDWRYYAEKVRKSKYDLDEALFKPYLSIENVREALFAVSNKLFGLKYRKLSGIQAYHRDVDVYEVIQEIDGESKLKAIFLHDNYARSFKQSGAWMSEYRSQTKNLDEECEGIERVPIVSNNNNFAKSARTLLSYDDARTMFHEFGHAHHGMLSDVTYGRLASTNVLTDFVELPSQLMENWFKEREVIKKYACHYENGEPIPDTLLDKLDAAKAFQQGFQTVEYTACALLDMALHQIPDYSGLNLRDFETRELARLGMPSGIVLRHRPAHFQHLFSTNMYAAGYYVYLWADVLVADAYAAFHEAGDCFDANTAAKMSKYIYSSGNTQAPDELFRQFRGRDPDISFLLREKCLV